MYEGGANTNNALKDSIGSRISSTLRLWNSMNVGISLADSGASYFIPCLIDNDFRSRRAEQYQ